MMTSVLEHTEEEENIILRDFARATDKQELVRLGREWMRVKEKVRQTFPCVYVCQLSLCIFQRLMVLLCAYVVCDVCHIL